MGRRSNRLNQGIVWILILGMTFTQGIPAGYSAEVLENEPTNPRILETTTTKTTTEKTVQQNTTNDFLMQGALKPSDEEKQQAVVVAAKAEENPKLIKADEVKKVFAANDAKNVESDGWFREEEGVWRTRANKALEFDMEFEQEGTYEFELTARNWRNNIPESYTHFAVDVLIDGVSKKTIYVEASKTEWHTGKVEVRIDTPGSHEVSFRWKNDYWNGLLRHDANIYMKEASVKYVPPVVVENVIPADGTVKEVDLGEGTVRGGEFWHVEEDGIWNTRGNKLLVYDITFEEAGKHKIQMEAMNYNRGNLPLGYGSFKLQVKVDGEEVGILEIEASKEELKLGELEIEIAQAGKREVTFEWINDVWMPPVGDSNIFIGSFKMNKLPNDPDPEPQPKEFAVNLVEQAINVDGNLDEAAWQEVGAINFSHATKSDNEVAVKLAWDTDHLYIAYDVKDASLGTNENSLWLQDGIDLYLDLGNEKTAGLDGNDYQLIANILGETNKTGVTTQTTTNATGYVMEIAISWDELGAAPFTGKEIGILLGNNDEDGGVGAQFDHMGLINTGGYGRPNLWDTITLEGGNILPPAPPVNKAPVMNVIGNQTVSENAELSVVVSATDEDGDALTYSVTGLPDGAAFDANTRTLTWTPTFEQAGDYEVTFNVTDGTDAVSETVTIAVTNTNRLPAIESFSSNAVDRDVQLAGTQVYPGDEVTYSGSVSDLDGESLHWEWIYKVDGGAEVVYNSGTGAVVNATFTYPEVTSSKNYEWILRVADGTDEVEQSLVIQVVPEPEPEPGFVDPLADYPFTGIAGDVITSTNNSVLPTLVIEDASKVAIREGAIDINESTLIASAGPATDLTNALQATNELTLEVWVEPENLTQTGPARILSLSSDTGHRNFTLGQSGGEYEVRLRTPETGENGFPHRILTTNSNVKLGEGPQHVVFTRDAAGNAKIFVNGTEVASLQIGGDFSNWDNAMKLLIGNEGTKDRPWLGSLHHVAIYDRAITQDNVSHRFLSGVPGGIAPPAPEPEPDPDPVPDPPTPPVPTGDRYRVPEVDVDADGMDDNWEKEHFGNLSHNGLGDKDNDGLLDVEEFRNYADPNVNSNIALGKSYTLSQNPDYRFTDDADDVIQLTDGRFVPCCGGIWQENPNNSTPEGMLALGWGHSNKFLEIVFDLGSIVPVAGGMFSTGGGTAGGVEFPKDVHMLVSDNGIDYYYAGALISGNVNPEPLPDVSDRFYRYKFKADGFNTQGRYVKVLIEKQPTSHRRFVDEIQIFTGGTNQPHQGKVFTDDINNFSQYLFVRQDTNDRLDEVIVRAQERGVDISEEAEAIRSRIEVMDFTNDELTNFKSFFPQPVTQTTPGIRNLGLIQRDILNLNARVLRAEGNQGIVTWESHSKWDNFDALRGPENPTQQNIAIERMMMNGERRGEVISLTNATDDEKTLTINIEGLPGGVNPDWINVYHVAAIEMESLGIYSDLLKPLVKTANGYQITIPSGMSLQVWIEFEPQALASGLHQGNIVVKDGASVLKNVTTKVSISQMQFSNELTMGMSGWDYLDGTTGTVLGDASNHQAILDLMDRYQMDNVWGYHTLLPWDKVPATYFDANNNFNAPASYFSRFDRFLNSHPDAKHYHIFMSLKFAAHEVTDYHRTFAGANFRTNPDLFDARIAGWLEAIEERMVNVLGVEPHKLSFHVLDEPGPTFDYELLARWAKAMTDRPVKHGTRIQVYGNASAHDPDTMLHTGVYDYLDILSPNYHVVQHQNPLHGNFEFFKDHYGSDPNKTLQWYTSIGTGSDAYAQAVVSGWISYRYGATAMNYWSLTDGTSKTLNMRNGEGRPHYSPMYVDGRIIYTSKRMETTFEGRQDYEYLAILERLKIRVANELPGRQDLLTLIDTTAQSAIDAVIAQALVDRQFDFFHSNKDRTTADTQRDRLWLLIEQIMTELAKD